MLIKYYGDMDANMMYIILKNHFKNGDKSRDEIINILHNFQKHKTNESNKNEVKHWIADYIIKNNFSNILKLKKQLTHEECIKLENLAQNPETIKIIIENMENHNQLNKKYVSVYLTIANWTKRYLNASSTSKKQIRNDKFDKAQSAINTIDWTKV